MRVVVNHLRLKEPLPDATIESAQSICRTLVEAGGTAASFVSVDPLHVILILTFPDAETEERIKTEIGGPWMNQHVAPYLADGTERSSGELIASA